MLLVEDGFSISAVCRNLESERRDVIDFYRKNRANSTGATMKDARKGGEGGGGGRKKGKKASLLT